VNVALWRRQKKTAHHQEKFEEGLVPKIDLTRAELPLCECRRRSAERPPRPGLILRDNSAARPGVEPRESLGHLDYEGPLRAERFFRKTSALISPVLRKELLVMETTLSKQGRCGDGKRTALEPKDGPGGIICTMRTPVINSLGDPPYLPIMERHARMLPSISASQFREDLLKSNGLWCCSRDKLANQKLDVVQRGCVTDSAP